MTDQSFKKLTDSNWRELDHHWPFAETPDGLVSIFLEEQLEPAVPSEIRRMFEVARGVACYGAFFYPAYTIGHDQLFRVLEAAVAEKCGRVDASTSRWAYGRQIKWLHEQKYIADDDYARWHAARQVRNFASHPRKQWIVSPDMVISAISIVTEFINLLFCDGDTRNDDSNK